MIASEFLQKEATRLCGFRHELLMFAHDQEAASASSPGFLETRGRRGWREPSRSGRAGTPTSGPEGTSPGPRLTLAACPLHWFLHSPDDRPSSLALRPRVRSQPGQPGQPKLLPERLGRGDCQQRTPEGPAAQHRLLFGPVRLGWPISIYFCFVLFFEDHLSHSFLFSSLVMESKK